MNHKEFEERSTLISQYEYVTPKEREDLIKQLILDLIGEEEKECECGECCTRNNLRAEQKQIVTGEEE